MADQTTARVLLVMPVPGTNTAIGGAPTTIAGSSFVIDPNALPQIAGGSNTQLMMRIRVAVSATAQAGDQLQVQSSDAGNTFPPTVTVATGAPMIASTAWTKVQAIGPTPPNVQIANLTAARGNALGCWIEFAYLPSP